MDLTVRFGILWGSYYRTELHMPEHWMDSRIANGLALSCADRELEQEFRGRVWRAVYERKLALDAGDWLGSLATDLGLEVGPAAQRTAQERLEISTLEAAEFEVSGVPSFVLGSWPLGGIQDDETMVAIFRRYAERRRLLS